MRPYPGDEPIETKHFLVAVDPQTGAICRLRRKESGRDWASARQLLAAFTYQTLSKEDYDRFFEAYLKSRADWARRISPFDVVTGGNRAMHAVLNGLRYEGFHFSLFNNGWGSNYVQWFGEDMRFRFRVSG